MKMLQEKQAPVIDAIGAFFTSCELNQQAAHVIAPCGSGKTMMTCLALSKTENIQRVIICVPSQQIQTQWCKTLIETNAFSPDDIHFIGMNGSTRPDTISVWLSCTRYCIITTYMSSYLIVDALCDNIKPDLVIFDEAHHMAGIVANDGQGITRRFLLHIVDLELKRLFLTFTPRFISNFEAYNNTNTKTIVSMDNRHVFGTLIAQLKIRDLIRCGILPDYRIWTLQHPSIDHSDTIRVKADCIAEAWKATEIDRNKEKSILHHLIIFTATIEDAKIVEEQLKEKLDSRDALILRVEDGDRLEEPLRLFAEAPRAILVNCFVLNEGVDIPIANAVAIMYPKKSRGQITQMVLRAGRWHENKPVFHILIPTIGKGEDWGGFEEVLLALASCDKQIRDEIMLRCLSSQSNDQVAKSNNPTLQMTDGHDACIMIEEYSANQADIRRCFDNLRKALFVSRESKIIRAICIERSIDTSFDYAALRNTAFPEWPEDPRPNSEMTWYDFLHPNSQQTRAKCISKDDLVTLLKVNQIMTGKTFEEWRRRTMDTNELAIPTIQHINDGFYGNNGCSNLSELFLSMKETREKKSRR